VTATANASFTPTVPTLTAALQVQPNPDGTLQVTWTSTGGCPAYNGTLTIKYPTDSRQVTVSGASGAITDQPPQFNCSTGVSYSLAFQRRERPEGSASKTAAIPSGSHWVGPRSTPDGPRWFGHRDLECPGWLWALHRCDHRCVRLATGKAGFQVTATRAHWWTPTLRAAQRSLTYTLTLSDSTKATVDATTGRVVWCLG